MCIILLKKKDQSFDPQYIEKMYDMGNRDGFGMMWVEKVEGVDRVRTKKSTMSPFYLKDFYKEKMDNDIAVHVRNATYGKKDLNNCHPYCVLDIDLGHKIDLYMMHNGTIREVQVDKDMSDSYNFATKFLRPLLAKGNNYRMLYDEEFQTFLSAIIGPNKLVFLDSKKRFTIVNADLGSYHPTGCWVSTKSEIKLPDPIILKKDSEKETHKATNGSFGHGTSWEYEKGEWVVDNDNRLHFTPKSIDSKKSKDEAEDTTDEASEEQDGTDNGIQLNNDVDEEGLDELTTKLPTMNRQEIYKFVVDYHVESVVMLTKLTNKPVASLDLMVKGRPWEAVDLLIQSAKEKYGNTEKVLVN